MPPQKTTKKNGFTLIEVMLAVMVLAMLSLAGYQTIDFMLIARERLTEVSEQNQSMSEFYYILMKDWINASNESSRSNFSSQESFAMKDPQTGEYFLTFVRRSNQRFGLASESDLERVFYKYDPLEKAIFRGSFQIFNSVLELQPTYHLVLNQVNSLCLTVVNKDGQALSVGELQESQTDGVCLSGSGDTPKNIPALMSLSVQRGRTNTQDDLTFLGFN